MIEQQRNEINKASCRLDEQKCNNITLLNGS